MTFKTKIKAKNKNKVFNGKKYFFFCRKKRDFLYNKKLKNITTFKNKNRKQANKRTSKQTSKQNEL
tara:strand:+ start:104 stop:301 length:198 start_codon:yes stop_codon:yes gene_type:complete